MEQRGQMAEQPFATEIGRQVRGFNLAADAEEAKVDENSLLDDDRGVSALADVDILELLTPSLRLERSAEHAAGRRSDEPHRDDGKQERSEEAARVEQPEKGGANCLRQFPQPMIARVRGGNRQSRRRVDGQRGCQARDEHDYLLSSLRADEGNEHCAQRVANRKSRPTCSQHRFGRPAGLCRPALSRRRSGRAGSWRPRRSPRGESPRQPAGVVPEYRIEYRASSTTAEPCPEWHDARDHVIGNRHKNEDDATMRPVQWASIETHIAGIGRRSRDLKCVNMLLLAAPGADSDSEARSFSPFREFAPATAVVLDRSRRL